MGGNSSKTMIDDVTKIVNTSINKTNNDINNSAECKSTSEQKIIFSTGGDMIVSNCKFTIDQSSEAKVKCMVESVQISATDISNDISEQLKSYSDRTIDQELEGMGMGSNKDEFSRISKNYIDNHLENIIENNIKNTLKSSTENENTIEVTVGKNFICDGNGEFDISQSGLLESISISIATQLVNTIIDTELEIDKEDILDEDIKTKNTGFTLSGSMGVLIGCACCLLVFGCVLVVGNPKTNQQAMGIAQAATYRPPQQLSIQGGAKLLSSKFGLYAIIIILLFINFYF